MKWSEGIPFVQRFLVGGPIMGIDCGRLESSIRIRKPRCQSRYMRFHREKSLKVEEIF